MSVAPMPALSDVPLLSLEDVRVNFYTARGVIHAVQDVTLHVEAGTTLGLVGESGSGKSVMAMAVLGLVPSPGRLDAGVIRWRGDDITDLRARARLRGRRVSMVFQDPMTSLNPLVPIGRQITEVLRKHKGMSRQVAEHRAVELLDLVGIPSPHVRLRQLPFELSGGMRQRVMIAIALAPEPDLLIADEPTTALDVTIQAQILELIAQLQETLGIAMMLITHDLGVVAGVCDRVAVMYAGRIVEVGPADQMFAHPRHPYTAALLAATPRLDQSVDRLEPIRGNPPNVAELVPGCAFAPRCPFATQECEVRPELELLAPDQYAACWNPR